MSIRSLGLVAAVAMLLFSSSAGAAIKQKPKSKAPVKTAPAARVAQRGPASASLAALAAGPRGGSHDISQELKITGQSRNLSMGLLFQKDKDKLSFGTARTNYKDKISNF